MFGGKKLAGNHSGLGPRLPVPTSPHQFTLVRASPHRCVPVPTEPAPSCLVTPLGLALCWSCRQGGLFDGPEVPKKACGGGGQRPFPLPVTPCDRGPSDCGMAVQRWWSTPRVSAEKPRRVTWHLFSGWATRPPERPSGLPPNSAPRWQCVVRPREAHGWFSPRRPLSALPTRLFLLEGGGCRVPTGRLT